MKFSAQSNSYDNILNKDVEMDRASLLSSISEVISRKIYYLQVATDLTSFAVFAPIVIALMQSDWVLENIESILLPMMAVSVALMAGMFMADWQSRRVGYYSVKKSLAFSLFSSLCQGGLFYVFAFAAMLVYYQTTGIILSAGSYLLFNIYVLTAMLVIVAQYDTHGEDSTSWAGILSMICMTLSMYLTIFIVPACFSVFDNLNVKITCAIIIYNACLAMAMSYGCDLDVERFMRYLGEDVVDLRDEHVEDMLTYRFLAQLSVRMDNRHEVRTEEGECLLGAEKC